MQGLSPAESQERPSRCDGTAPKRINPYPERSEVSPCPNGALPKATIFCISGSIGTAHRIYHTFFRRRCKPAFLSCDSFSFPSICKNVLSSILLNGTSRRLCLHLCTLFLSYLNEIGSAIWVSVYEQNSGGSRGKHAVRFCEWRGLNCYNCSNYIEENACFIGIYVINLKW